MTASHNDIVSERNKYQRMWAEPRYRNHSPGEKLVTEFLTKVQWQPGDTLIDLGCGTGRAAAKMAQKGMLCFLFDICRDAVDPDVKLPFIEGCLWELPGMFAFDWVFCADVLEHIPPAHIDATLDGMAAITRKGGFIQVAHFPDGCGQLIGEKLHLTLESPTWWRDKIAKRWPVTRFESDGAHSWAVLGRSWINDSESKTAEKDRWQPRKTYRVA